MPLLFSFLIDPSLLPPFAAAWGKIYALLPLKKISPRLGCSTGGRGRGKNKGFVRSLTSSENAHFRGNLMPYSPPMAAVAVAVAPTTIERREEYSEYSKTSPLLLFSSSSALWDGARFAIFRDKFLTGAAGNFFSASLGQYMGLWESHETFVESQDQVASHSPPPFFPPPPHPLPGKRRKPTHTNSLSPRGGWSLPV